MKWFIGTAGWSYAPWRGLFYPKGLPSGDWLGYYAQHFNAIEINNTFYRIPGAKQIQIWENKTPDDFTFAFKAFRNITHLTKLADPETTLPEFMLPMAARTRPGPILFQLPPGFKKDMARLKAFIDALPKPQRYTIEFRNPSWHVDEVYDLLRAAEIAFCMFEKENARSPRIKTAGFTYLRLHGRERGYKGNYDLPALKDWRDWLTEQRVDAYVFFDNTARGIEAIENAKLLQDIV
jgi:uncharacterized protein YecE (DUF72 family)